MFWALVGSRAEFSSQPLSPPAPVSNVKPCGNVAIHNVLCIMCNVQCAIHTLHCTASLPTRSRVKLQTIWQCGIVVCIGIHVVCIMWYMYYALCAMCKTHYALHSLSPHTLLCQASNWRWSPHVPVQLIFSLTASVTSAMQSHSKAQARYQWVNCQTFSACQ